MLLISAGGVSRSTQLNEIVLVGRGVLLLLEVYSPMPMNDVLVVLVYTTSMRQNPETRLKSRRDTDSPSLLSTEWNSILVVETSYELHPIAGVVHNLYTNMYHTRIVNVTYINIHEVQ